MGGGAHAAHLNVAGALLLAVPLHAQGHQAQEAVNYYSFLPPQGSVRNLSHSLRLSACWECLLSFLGAAERNTPLLLVTYLEEKRIDILVNVLTTELDRL